MAFAAMQGASHSVPPKRPLCSVDRDAGCTLNAITLIEQGTSGANPSVSGHAGEGGDRKDGQPCISCFSRFPIQIPFFQQEGMGILRDFLHFVRYFAHAKRRFKCWRNQCNIHFSRQSVSVAT